MNAWIVLIYPSSGIYLDSLREVYESFVIYSFQSYLFNFLHYDTNLEQYIDYKPGPRHLFPLCCLPTCVGGKTLLLRCKHGILQYVVIRPSTTLIAFISFQFDFFGEGYYNPLSGKAFPILLLVNNLSQIVAMYCLVIFYTSYKQELQPMKPLGKFLSIKLVVFFSFFQQVVISALMEVDQIRATLSEFFGIKESKVTIILQELLICFDMLVASIVHQYTFPHDPFIDDDDDSGQHDDNQNLIRSRSGSSSKGQSYRDAFMNLMDFSNEKSDLGEHFIQIFERARNLFRFGSSLPEVVDVPASSRGSTSAEYDTALTASMSESHYETTREFTTSSSGTSSSQTLINYQSIR